MKIGLVVVKGRPEGMEIPLPGPQFLIGRDPRCNLRPSSEAISKLHCAILHKKDGVYVRDMKSTNGTFINNDRISEIKVKDGDLLRIGPLVLAFKIAEGVVVAGAGPGSDEDQAVSWLLDYGAGSAGPDGQEAGSKTTIMDLSGGSKAGKQEAVPTGDTKVDGDPPKAEPAPKRKSAATPEVAGDLLEKLLEPPRKKKR